jgi:hypothetical protein
MPHCKGVGANTQKIENILKSLKNINRKKLRKSTP